MGKYISPASMPAFTSGSEKQQAWARTIRIDCLSSFIGQLAVAEKKYMPEQYAEIEATYEAVMQSHTDAKFWIDNRNKIDEVIFAEMQAHILAAHGKGK